MDNMKKKKGQTLLELALVLPILLVFFCGIVDFGRILHAGATINLVSQESVRLAGLGKSDIEVIQFAKEKAYFKDKTEISVSISPTDAVRKSGDYVTVNINYNVRYITPIISAFTSSAYVVRGKATIRVE
jgi:Flp pilus assembly protein TadG